MALPVNRNETEITALPIAPDRELARQFVETLPATSGFQIPADLWNYPPQQTIGIRLRQLRPEVVLLDLRCVIGKGCRPQ